MTTRSSRAAGIKLQAQNWSAVEHSLDFNGNALLPGVLTSTQCEDLITMYQQDKRYRARIFMARHGFGLGEYKYFAYPLPDILEQLRTAFYIHLAPIANRWNQLMNINVRYPVALQGFLDRCHAAGQVRPTPLILKYVEGGYNCLHRDLYGEHVFPLQVVILLNRPGEDFTGGEFVMTESVTSQQRADVVPLYQGDGIVFTVNQRPVQARRGIRKVSMRHGVSRVRSGNRHTIGLIFHDAR